MNKIIFPRNIKQHYYKYHYRYLLNIFKEAGVTIEFGKAIELDTTRFIIWIDGQEVLIDFSDSPKLHPDSDKYKYVLKYHYTEGLHESIPNLIPIGSTSFYEWKAYFDLEPKIKYTCNNNIVLNNQRVYANAKVRRSKVRKMLEIKYGNLVDFTFTDKKTYWEKINNCLVHVFVPGFRNDIYDKAHAQYNAFGCCSISPYINTILAYKQKLIPNTHYIECKPDYSDLIEKIEWCKTHRKECIQIGQNAKKLFAEVSTPKGIVKWITTCLK